MNWTQAQSIPIALVFRHIEGWQLHECIQASDDACASVMLQDNVDWAQAPIFSVDLVYRETEGRLGFRPRLEDVEAAALTGLDITVNSVTGIPKAGSTDGRAVGVCSLAWQWC